MFDWRSIFRIKQTPEATADVAEDFTTAEHGMTTAERTRLQQLNTRLQAILRLIYEDEIARSPDQSQAFIIWRKNLAIRLRENPTGKTSAILLATLGRTHARPVSIENVEENALWAKVGEDAEKARNDGKRRCSD